LTTSSDWHPADILAAIKKAGWTVTGLSEAHGYHRATLWKTLSTRPHNAGQRIIADAIGVPATEIWPSRYDAAGRFIDRRGRKPSTASGARHPRRRKAA
jgi:Ner family transcriptional regulator